MNEASSATGINKHGQIVGQASTLSGDKHAFLYENGIMTDLGTLPGDTSSSAAAINDRGQIVGTSGFPGEHAFLFDNGVMIDLGTLPGGTSSGATAINNHGQVVGSSTATNALNHATLWTPAN